MALAMGNADFSHLRYCIDDSLPLKQYKPAFEEIYKSPKSINKYDGFPVFLKAQNKLLSLQDVAAKVFVYDINDEYPRWKLCEKLKLPREKGNYERNKFFVIFNSILCFFEPKSRNQISFTDVGDVTHYDDQWRSVSFEIPNDCDHIIVTKEVDHFIHFLRMDEWSSYHYKVSLVYIFGIEFLKDKYDKAIVGYVKELEKEFGAAGHLMIFSSMFLN